MPGIAWNSCCSPCPHGARRTTHHMWSAFILRGQVQSTICPCEIAGTPPKGQLYPMVFFIKDREKPTGARPTPSRRAFTAHPQDSKCFHSVVNLQECQRLVAHHGHSLYTLLWGETFQTLSSRLAFSSVNRETVGVPNRISNRAVLVNLQHGTHSLNLHYTP